MLKFFCLFSLRNIKFNYCILDEGHVIKNGKTKLSKAVKQLTANYRIILSGTPIQVTIYFFFFFNICHVEEELAFGSELKERFLIFFSL